MNFFASQMKQAVFFTGLCCLFLFTTTAQAETQSGSAVASPTQTASSNAADPSTLTPAATSATTDDVSPLLTDFNAEPQLLGDTEASGSQAQAEMEQRQDEIEETLAQMKKELAPQEISPTPIAESPAAQPEETQALENIPAEAAMPAAIENSPEEANVVAVESPSESVSVISPALERSADELADLALLNLQTIEPAVMKKDLSVELSRDEAEKLAREIDRSKIEEHLTDQIKDFSQSAQVQHAEDRNRNSNLES